MQLVKRLFLLMLAVLVLVGAAGCLWLQQALPLPNAAQAVDLSIEPGLSARSVADSVAAAGVQVNPSLLYAWFRLSGQARKIKAGSYEIEPGTTPYTLLQLLVQGQESLRTVTLVEGWTFNQFRAALAKAPDLRAKAQAQTPEDIMAQLGQPGQYWEGRFFPDTYAYAKGSSDIAILKRALHAMDKRLAAAWAQRSAGSPLKTPHDLLVLASIVEKETGKGSDRPLVGGVFNNRLRIGMMLQTDPTVIYGMGEQFDGNLRKRDLQTDTPWNTYTRGGLQPTPIAMPGAASLLAAVKPADTKALYFVARGDGSSQFSATLDEHNRAVNKYQRGK